MRFSTLTRTFQKNSNNVGGTVRSFLSPYLHSNKAHQNTPVSPAQKLFKRYTAIVAVIFAIGSFTPINASTDEFYDEAYFNDTQALESPLITNEDGYLAKVNPQTNNTDRSTMHDYLVHTVASGETLSTIAQSYNLKSNTILWANGISNANSIRSGQEIIIPPVDGVNHRVGKGEDLSKIAKKYNVSVDSIVNQNGLTDKVVAVNQDIFIPGGKPLVIETPKVIAQNRNTQARVGTTSRTSAIQGGAVLQGSDTVPAGNKPFIFPTRGKITQGYHRGHYAFDIADPSRPAVWAAGGGTVVKVNEGCGEASRGCGGGYGNHVIIDHGNGLKTLYAHLTYSTVKVGDYVNQGDAIGKMGRSGNVYGRTGIHLHFEVHKNGSKLPPSNFY